MWLFWSQLKANNVLSHVPIFIIYIIYIMIIIILKWFGMFNSNVLMILYDHMWLHVNMPHGIFKWI